MKIWQFMMVINGFVTILMFGFLFAPEWSLRRYNDGTIIWFGLFSEHRDGQYKSAVCHDDQSALYCGYLKASQVSGILYVILGIWTTLLYIPKIFNHIELKKYRIYSSIVSGNVQAFFGLMCSILWGIFTMEYINQKSDADAEYDSERFSGYLSIAFYFMVVCTCITFFSSMTTLYLYNKTYNRKSKFENEKMEHGYNDGKEILQDEIFSTLHQS